MRRYSLLPASYVIIFLSNIFHFLSFSISYRWQGHIYLLWTFSWEYIGVFNIAGNYKVGMNREGKRKGNFYVHDFFHFFLNLGKGH